MSTTIHIPAGVLRIEWDMVDISSGASREFVPGQVNYYLNDEPISEAEAKQLKASAISRK